MCCPKLYPVQVSEALTDTERAKVYAAGQPVQQQFLAHSLAGLVATSGPAAFVAIAPRLPQLADALDEEGQVGGGYHIQYAGKHCCSGRQSLGAKRLT